MSLHAEKCYRIALIVLLVLVLANALAAGLRTVSDTDMGWHLATGRWVVQHHAIPSTDVLSYTAAGTRWIYPPFAGVLLYLIFCAAGYVGLSWFCALACVGTVAYLVRKLDLASIVLAMCSVEPIAFRTGPRADLFNTVFLAIFLGELWAFQRGSSKRLWLLPITMLIWVNFHPGFILGLAVIGAYLLLEACEFPFAGRRTEALMRLRQAWPWLAGTAAVTLVNFWGPKLYSASFTLAGLRGQQQGAYNTSASIGEFLAVPLSTHLLKRLVDFRHPENRLHLADVDCHSRNTAGSVAKATGSGDHPGGGPLSFGATRTIHRIVLRGYHHRWGHAAGRSLQHRSTAGRTAGRFLKASAPAPNSARPGVGVRLCHRRNHLAAHRGFRL